MALLSKSVTRAEALNMFWELAGKPEVECELTYKDIDDSKYVDAIRWATAIKVAEGHSPEAFGPEQPVVRQQLITFVYRYVKLYGGGFDGEVPALTVADADEVSSWAVEPCAYCLANGYVEADKDGKLNPKAELTVAEAKELLEKAIPEENKKLGILDKIKSMFKRK